MASYAKIDPTNIVVGVHVVNDADEGGSEAKGIEFLTSVHGDISPNFWKKTSYHTFHGAHTLDGTPFRKNHAGKGFTWDESRDAFIPPRPIKCNGAITHNSWIFDESKCAWFAPVQWPEDSHPGQTDHEGEKMTFSWDEHKVRMVGQKQLDPRPADDQITLYAWDPNTGTWSDSGFTFHQFLDMNYTGD